MNHDICYSRRGDKFASRVLKTVRSEAEARVICADLSNFPTDTINIVVVREDDGKDVYDLARDGFLS